MHLIEFENFSCYYLVKKEYIPALQDITLSIDAGELFVVLGASGSGKTTLLKSIAGMCDYIQGQLRIDGLDTEQYRPQKGNIGFIRQEVNLYPHMTVYENIAFPLRMMHTPQSEVDRRVKEIAELLDIRWLLTRKPKQLSGGQHQRVALGRALVKNPVMVLFDEPFSNIDPVLRTQLRQLVKNVHQTLGCTMVFVTHDLQEACALADRIAILDNGCLSALGTPAQLLGNLK